MRESKERRAAEAYVERLQMLRRTVDLEIERAREALRILGLLEDADLRRRRLQREERQDEGGFRADDLIPSPSP